MTKSTNVRDLTKFVILRDCTTFVYSTDVFVVCVTFFCVNTVNRNSLLTLYVQDTQSTKEYHVKGIIEL